MDELEMKLFDSERTKKQLTHVYKVGLETCEPVWNFGYPILTAAFPTLINGLWYVLSPENLGKSMLQLNIGYNVLTHNPDAYWLDFSLDDGIENRWEYLLARAGGIPINLVHQAGDAEEEEKVKRHATFTDFYKQFGTRYHLFGATTSAENYEEHSFTAEWIIEVVGRARQQIGATKKLFVTVDSFHDVGLVEKHSDVYDQLSKKSARFKAASGRDNVLYLLTAHTTKNTRKRGQTADAMWGTADLNYDARIMTHLYSDVNLNREKASVFWFSQEHPNQMMPVHELDIIKNKAGGKKELIFYNFYPHQCRDVEVDEVNQQYYRQCIYSSSKKKEK